AHRQAPSVRPCCRVRCGTRPLRAPGGDGKDATIGRRASARRRCKMAVSPCRNAPMSSHALTALSPLDGRYAGKVEPLRPIFSEYGLMHARVQVEIAWLLALAAEPGLPEVAELSDEAQAFLRAIADGFSEADGARIKAIETTTNHDVKAVEYFIKERLEGHHELAAIREF